jgi:hypothetical protein
VNRPVIACLFSKVPVGRVPAGCWLFLVLFERAIVEALVKLLNGFSRPLHLETQSVQLGYLCVPRRSSRAIAKSDARTAVV